MSKVIKGRALIIAMTEFKRTSGGTGEVLDPRKGAKSDTRRLFKILTRLGYKVSLHLDISVTEIRELYKKESEKPQGDCFISVLSSHGQEGIIYDFHGNQIRLSDIYNMLSPSNCPALAGIPKLFFIQACRGSELDEGVALETDSGPGDTEGLSHILSIPNDTVVMFATTEGYVAFQNPAGSIFLQTLCDLLEGEEKNLTLNQILTRLGGLVAYEFQSKGQYAGYKEMPCFVTNLTYEMYPFRQGEKPSSPMKRSTCPVYL
ncbi:caspase-7-like [Bombina bombina]|uniref:caspase-7-like n=1 Tax=Bombina bombina TaxID=8345 RepID=UPI00235A50C2|nr:caspase-7-like [Bombina bombina]